MNRFRLLAAALAAFATVATASPAVAEGAPDPLGDWSGALKTPRGELTLIVHVKKGAAGALAATLESPDQGPGEMPASEISAAGGHMAWKVASVGASYKGDWDAAKGQWQGTFSQGSDMPLALSRGLPPAKPVVAGLDGRWEGAIAVNGTTIDRNARVSSTKLRPSTKAMTIGRWLLTIAK